MLVATPRHARPRARSRERGDAMVGFVIGFPIAFTLIVLLVQVVLLAWGNNAAQHAALAAAREARVESGTDEAAYALAAEMLTQSGALTQFDVDIDRGDQVSVTVTGEVAAIVPLWQPTVSHTASGPIEEFIDDGAMP